MKRKMYQYVIIMRHEEIERGHTEKEREITQKKERRKKERFKKERKKDKKRKKERSKQRKKDI